MKETFDKYDVKVLKEYAKSMTESYRAQLLKKDKDSSRYIDGYNEGRLDAYADILNMIDYLMKEGKTK